MVRTFAAILLLGCFNAARAADRESVISYSGGGSDLQKVVDDTETGAVIECDPKRQIQLAAPVVLRKAIRLRRLNAALPKGLGDTSLVVVEAAGVTISDCEFHGNYDSVSQKQRAPLVRIQAGDFKVERCRFYDGSKDGVNVAPGDPKGGQDIVGGIIRDIKAYRMGRDAVSISGGNEGLRVRNVTVENVRLEKGYHRGAVEVSDGSDNVTVRNVYAQDAVYAVDVQDHGEPSAANTNITIENVEAVRCKHILRTANGARGHANLTLRNFVGRECALPLKVSNTSVVRVEQLMILNHTSKKEPPVRFDRCKNVLLTNVRIQTSEFAAEPVKLVRCEDVRIDNLTVDR